MWTGAVRRWACGWSVLGMLGAASCASGQTAAAPLDPATIEEERARSSLDDAVDRYHDTGDVAQLSTWVAAHPGHPDIDTWREVVAMRAYEAMVIGDPWAVETLPEPDAQLDPDYDPVVAPLLEPTVAQLLGLVDAYPGTIAADTAQAVLEEDGLKRLMQPPFNDNLVAFLEGRDDWVRDDTGRVTMPNVDLDAFRNRHEGTLRGRIGQRLLEDGCTDQMGYCTWYVHNFPEDRTTPLVKTAMKAEWYRRGHPRWRSKAYATCAYRCARGCRDNAQPLQDACYDPCFARCD